MQKNKTLKLFEEYIGKYFILRLERISSFSLSLPHGFYYRKILTYTKSE